MHVSDMKISLPCQIDKLERIEYTMRSQRRSLSFEMSCSFSMSENFGSRNETNKYTLVLSSFSVRKFSSAKYKSVSKLRMRKSMKKNQRKSI